MTVRWRVSRCIIMLVMMEVTMGGVGSGAKRSTNVGNVDDAIALDIRVLRRLGAVRPGECIIDDVYWSKRGLRTASARLRADVSVIERGGVMTITGTMPDGAIKQHVAIEPVASAYRGHRCYFVCPVTADRCEVLYYAGGRFASRNAHRLSYTTQNLTDLSRARRKVAKLVARLDGEAGYRRPRGRRRLAVIEKLEDASLYAGALYLQKLRSRIDPSGTGL